MQSSYSWSKASVSSSALEKIGRILRHRERTPEIKVTRVLGLSGRRRPVAVVRSQEEKRRGFLQEVTSTARQVAVLRLTTVLDEPTLARKALINIFISLSLVKLPRTARSCGREAAKVSWTASSGRRARAARQGRRFTKYGRHWGQASCEYP